MKTSVLISLLLLALSCGKSDDEQLQQHSQIIRMQTVENLNLILKNANTLEVEVMYEAGAEPYTDKSFRQQHYFAFLEMNIAAIYQTRGRNVALTVPKELSQMSLLPIFNKDSWTISEIKQTIETSSKKSSSASHAVIKVLFVKGHFKDDEGIKDRVIGINITGTPYIVIFKDVVENMGTRTDDKTAKFSEQSTLIHEFGHVIGLVNNGVAQVVDHQDKDHGAHCKNTDCVMNWKNEGSTEMINYIQNYFSSGNEVMFGSQCLDDVKKF